MAWFCVAGCESVATDEAGVFVTNVAGTYDRAAITNSGVCTPNFDTVVTVVQSEDRFTILSENDGFDDLVGLFDEGQENSYTLSGAGKACTGNFVEGLLSIVCTVSIKTCTIDPDTAEESCNDEEYSCQITYQRR